MTESWLVEVALLDFSTPCVGFLTLKEEHEALHTSHFTLAIEKWK